MTSSYYSVGCYIRPPTTNIWISNYNQNNKNIKKESLVVEQSFSYLGFKNEDNKAIFENRWINQILKSSRSITTFFFVCHNGNE